MLNHIGKLGWSKLALWAGYSICYTRTKVVSDKVFIQIWKAL